MKRVAILSVFLSLVQIGITEELIINQMTRISADHIARTETADGDVIVAQGNAIVIQENGGFSGYKFASLETPILYDIQKNSIQCSGWFYATNGKVTFGFSEFMAQENRMIFRHAGDVTESVVGVILIPKIPNQREMIDEHLSLIEGAKTLIESRNGKTEQGGAR